MPKKWFFAKIYAFLYSNTNIFIFIPVFGFLTFFTTCNSVFMNVHSLSNNILIPIILILGFFVSCASPKKETKGEAEHSLITEQQAIAADTSSKTRGIPEETLKPKTDSVKKEHAISAEELSKLPFEDAMKALHLVDVQALDPSIKVQLMYSTMDNFMKADVYGDLTKAYAQPEVAKMLVKAQANLKKAHPDYSLIIYDAARPYRVQQKMWTIVKGTSQQDYVAEPDAIGSIHNYGSAIDLSVVDKNGKPLDMGTKFDFLGALAEPKLQEKFLKEGKLTQAQLDNREILNKAMSEAGFMRISNEWWHFDAFSHSKREIAKRFKRVP